MPVRGIGDQNRVVGQDSPVQPTLGQLCTVSRPRALELDAGLSVSSPRRISGAGAWVGGGWSGAGWVLGGWVAGGVVVVVVVVVTGAVGLGEVVGGGGPSGGVVPSGWKVKASTSVSM